MYQSTNKVCFLLCLDEILRTMNDGHDSPPVIMPLSNPTSRAECTAEAAQRCTNGRAIFASGSPFKDVEYEGKTIASSQCNNRYVNLNLTLSNINKLF